MKYYQFFKTYKCFDNKREKNTHTAVNERIKKLISWTLFYSRSFYYFATSSVAQFSLFMIRIMQEISKGKTGSDK